MSATRVELRALLARYVDYGRAMRRSSDETLELFALEQRASADLPTQVAKLIDYPPSAYAPNGILWWDLKVTPGTKKQKFGDEQKLFAWLAHHKVVGDTFTTAELRAVLGEEDNPNVREHFQRRMRAARQHGWKIPSVKYDRNIVLGEYRLEVIGWHPGSGLPRPRRRSNASAKDIKRVRTRDGNRCVICGIGSNEPHPLNDDLPAVITIGHVIAVEHGGSTTQSNLQCECTICNEPLRDEAAQPASYDEMYSELRSLRNQELRMLLQWVLSGRRIRNNVDDYYDRWRFMAPGDRERLAEDLKKMVRKNP